MRRWLRRATLPSFLFAAILLTAPAALASGSGYNLSFSQSSNGSVNSAVDLVSLSSSTSGSAQLSISFTVAGSVGTTNAYDTYYVYFGGNSASSATGYFLLSDNATAGILESAGSGSFGYGAAPFTVSGGGSTLSFLVNTSAVGASSGFSLNAIATSSSPSGTSDSYLGSDYNGGGTCNAAGCISAPAVVNNIFSGLILIAVISLVAIVVIVVVVVIVVTRKKRMPPPMGWTAAPGQQMPPPPPPPMGQPPSPPPPGSS
ncbi:MAG: hypothetical protein L3J87_04270 [Thermoplasmata archaeon]|nr:hypothetical protein [Thermoplasmata archaeon]MCI4344821.1 hypothetical protein [Thermoplasmata archaeon]